MSEKDMEADQGLGEDDQSDMDVDDPELQAIRMRVREMEEETERLKGLGVEGPKAGPPRPPSAEEKQEADKRSVYVGNNRALLLPALSRTTIRFIYQEFLIQISREKPAPAYAPLPIIVIRKCHPLVDYGGTAQDLESHFSGCGTINRITILCDKFSGHPKGYAYIEFVERSSVEAAILMDESVFRGRTLKVLPKRTNMPGISTTDRGGFRGRSQGQRGQFQRGHRPRMRAFRGRGRTGPWNNPY